MEEKDFKLILLSAKIGILFAKIDNDYDEFEKNFIKSYLDELQENPTDEQLKTIWDIEDQKFNLPDILKETDEYLSLCSEDEKEVTLNSFMDFIENVIKINKEIHPNEIELYNQWKAHFNL